MEEEQVHIGRDGHLASRVAAHRREADARADLAPSGEIAGLRDLVEPADQPVEGVGIGFVDRLARFPGPVARRQVGAHRVEVGAHGGRQRRIVALATRHEGRYEGIEDGRCAQRPRSAITAWCWLR